MFEIIAVLHAKHEWKKCIENADIDPSLLFKPLIYNALTVIWRRCLQIEKNDQFHDQEDDMTLLKIHKLVERLDLRRTFLREWSYLG